MILHVSILLFVVYFGLLLILLGDLLEYVIKIHSILAMYMDLFIVPETLL